MKREIIYPFLVECCRYTDDTFWKNIFEELAFGTTPYGTYLVKDHLTCGYKDKEFAYKIEKKSPEILYKEITILLKEKLGLLSREEIIRKKTESKKYEENNEKLKNDWLSIKRKNIKDLLIERYVIKMKRKHSLTTSQAKYLLSVIFIAFIFKTLTPEDIDYRNGEILNIEGIEFETGKINLKRDIYDLEPNVSPDIIIDKQLMEIHWYDYLEKLRKEC